MAITQYLFTLRKMAEEEEEEEEEESRGSNLEVKMLSFKTFWYLVSKNTHVPVPITYSDHFLNLLYCD